MSASPELPAAFGDFFAGLEEQRYTDQPGGDRFRRCFGCGPDHPEGLHVRFFRDADGIVAPVVIPRRFEGPPGAAHGGIVAAYLDEVLGAAAARASGRATVTGELSVQYRLPTPTETALLARSRAVAVHARYVEVEGALEEFATRRVVATARGRFFPLRA